MNQNLVIPYTDLAGQHYQIKQELLDAIERVLDHGRFILGDEVEEFERRFAELCEVQYAIGVNSGTDAILLALKSLGIGPGDEVITAPNSFVATASCIALVGAHPIFVDVGDDYNIDPSLIEQAITPRTRAIIPVHWTGRSADMDPILEIAKAHGIHVIEDAAQAVTAEYKDRRVGSFGIMGCFSLHPLKTLNACGDGGVITTNDQDLSEKLRKMRNLGLEDRGKAAMWSGNSRLDTIQAAILLVKLHHFENWTEKRRVNARFYQQHLINVPGIQVPTEKTYERSVYHTFIIQSDDRDRLKFFLRDQGIGTSIHYEVPIHLQNAAAHLGYNIGDFPVTEMQSEKILSLPIYDGLIQSNLETIIDAIQLFHGA